MGFLERAIRKGVSDAVGKAIGGAVKDAVTPTAEKYVNRAANQLDEATKSVNQSVEQTQQATQQAAQQTSGLDGAFANLQRSMESFATQASKNMKICPACGEGTTAEKSFCPSCGAKLPEMTVAQGAVCSSCGTQNTVGTKFCQSCGAKLPAAIAEEQAAADKNAAVLAQWDTVLAGFPKWELGGKHFEIECGDGYTEFCAVFDSDFAAQNAVNQYKQVLRQNGFREAGEYPDRDHLYNMIGGVCCHVDTEHCFDGGRERASIYFMHDEPTGGFNYVKPTPPKKTGLFDLFR